MANPVRFNVYVTVREGREDEFKRLAKEWIAGNAKRPEVLSYEWFFEHGDETRVQVMETYADGDALLAYLERGSGDGTPPDYPYVTTRLEVCGNISAALKKRLDGGATEVSYYDHFAGFTR